MGDRAGAAEAPLAGAAGSGAPGAAGAAAGGAGASAGMGGTGSGAVSGAGAGLAPGAAGSADQPGALPPCPAGSQLVAPDRDAGFAEYGSVFSSTAYARDDADSHAPKALEIRVENQGTPVAGCAVAFSTTAGNGWVFANATQTDAGGRVRAFWTAGDRAEQTATAEIQIEGGGTDRVEFTGSASPSERTRTDSVHISYDVPDEYSEIRVQVTPVTGPESTYYSTLNWPGAYGGIQFDESDGGEKSSKVIFSVWDVDDAHPALIIDAGASNQTVGFGGEGTGTGARLLFPPSTHGAVPGLPDDYTLEPGHTYETHLVITYPDDCSDCSDYTFYFSDVTRGLGPVSLGTQRYASKETPWYASGFIEDWWDAPGDHCLNTGARTAYFHDIRVKTLAGWEPVTRATFDAVYRPDNHEICANYFFAVRDGRFLASSGGNELVSRPIIDGDEDFGSALEATLP
jgi:hypothetical protein